MRDRVYMQYEVFMTLYEHDNKSKVHKYMQYEVFMTLYMCMITNQRKVPKWLPFKKRKSESLTI